MKTKHYVVENIAEFSEQTEAVKKLQTYLDYIERIFPVIEEVFSQKWSDNRINIKLNNSTGGANHSYSNGSHIVEMGINNRNIQKKYPENLWGCLFHETHHALFDSIIRNKENRKIFNGGHEAEVFNYAFMATTYLRLKERNNIDTQVYEHFLRKLERELDKCDKKYRASNEYEYERELPNDTMDIFHEYVNMFSANTENFAKFIDYVKSSDMLFANLNNFRQDLDKAKEFLAN